MASGAVATATTHAPGIDTPILFSIGPTADGRSPVYVIGTNVRGDAVFAAWRYDGSAQDIAELSPWGEQTFIAKDGSTCVRGKEDVGGTSLPQDDCPTWGSILKRFGIGGARMHPRTKLVDLRNRVYATHLKGFLTRDPLGAVDSQGLWNYVAGDPINFRDPWGLKKKHLGGSTERGAGVEDELQVVFCGDSSAWEWCTPDDSRKRAPAASPPTPPGFQPDPPLGGPSASSPPGTSNSPPESRAGAADDSPGGLKDLLRDLREWWDSLFRDSESARRYEESRRQPDPGPANAPNTLNDLTGSIVQQTPAVAGEIVLTLGSGLGKSRIRGNRTRSPGCPGCPCFVAGTLILLADGELVPIEEVQIGDWVLADNPEDGQPPAPAQVTNVMRSSTHRLIVMHAGGDDGGGIIEATGEHPFWTSSSGWVAADSLVPGDLLVDADGDTVAVFAIEEKSRNVETFNLSVNNFETYFVVAGGQSVLVHNQSNPQTPPQLPEKIIYDDGVTRIWHNYGNVGKLPSTQVEHGPVHFHVSHKGKKYEVFPSGRHMDNSDPLPRRAREVFENNRSRFRRISRRIHKWYEWVKRVCP